MKTQMGRILMGAILAASATGCDFSPDFGSGLSFGTGGGGGGGGRPPEPSRVPISFIAAANYPHGPDEVPMFVEHMNRINELRDEEAVKSLFVHLGGIFGPGEGCFEQRYIDVANAVESLTIPGHVLVDESDALCSPRRGTELV